MPPTPVVTRFAPSPTGHLHIGGARSALFCWAFAHRARKDGHDGRFMLRIEDTDAARSSEESARGIMDDLAWLGIEWDDGPELKSRHQASGLGLQGGKGPEAKEPGASATGQSAPASRAPTSQQRTIGGDSRRVGPYFQAQRVDLYNRELERLVRAGRAYPAFETNEENEAARKAAVAAKQTYRYARPADVEFGKFTPAMAARWERAKAGERHVLRFAAPHEEIVVKDLVLGDVKIAPGELDDFVIRKADGFPTYHFAVVVDDETMGVTHVMRAQEHLANTPRHVALQKALGYRHPLYAHMPLIFNNDGSKMSKRDKAKAARKAAKDAMAKDNAITAATLAAALAKEPGASATGQGVPPSPPDEKLIAQFLAAENDSIDVAEAFATHFKVTLPEIEVWDFRKNGYLPEAITNFIGLLGWNPGMKLADGKDLEKFDMNFLADNFSIERIGRTNAKFDRAKLLSFNADVIGAMSEDEFVDRWLAWMEEHEPTYFAKASKISRGQLLVLARALKPRAKTLRDALRPAAFAFVTDDGYEFDKAAVEKNLLANDRAGLKLLEEFRPRLEAVDDWSPAPINAAIEEFAKEKGMPNPGGIAQPLRVAVTGAGVSPGLGETLAVLGRASALARVARCLSECGR